MKKIYLFITFFVVLLSLPFIHVPQTYAYSFKTGTSINLPSGKTIDEALYTFGQNLEINSNVNGDLICGGQTVTINGNVSGDVICAAQTITINGYVNGTIRIAAQNVSLVNKVYSNVTIFAQSVSIGSTARIGGDLTILTQDANIQGEIGRDLAGSIGGIGTIDGTIGRNVQLNINHLTVGGDASIGGNLAYTSLNKAMMLNIGAVKGTTTRSIPASPPHEKEINPFLSIIDQILLSVLSFLLIGALIILFLPQRSNQVTEIMKKNPFETIGIGIIVFIAIPLIAFILLFTVIGIPLSILLVVLLIAMILISSVLVALLIGHMILPKLRKRKDQYTPFIALALGALVCGIVFSIPCIGFLLTFIAVIWGIGGISRTFRVSRKEL